MSTKAEMNNSDETVEPSAAIDEVRTSGHLERWLVCRTGSRLWAVPLAHALEVMRSLPIEPIAGAPGFVSGVSLIRGEPVPVVHTGLLIGERATEIRRFVSIRVGSRQIALTADAVVGIRAVGSERANEMPPLLRGSAAETIAAISTLDHDLLYVLRDACIVPEAVFCLLETRGAAA